MKSILICLFFTNCYSQSFYISKDATYSFFKRFKDFEAWSLTSENPERSKSLTERNNILYQLDYDDRDCSHKFYLFDTVYKCIIDSFEFNEFLEEYNLDIRGKKINPAAVVFKETYLGPTKEWDYHLEDTIDLNIVQLDLFFKDEKIGSDTFKTSDYLTFKTLNNNYKDIQIRKYRNKIFVCGAILSSKKSDAYSFDIEESMIFIKPLSGK